MRSNLVMLRVLSVLVIATVVGCTPTCEQTCNKLLDCEDENLQTPLMNLDECTSACAAQSNQYEDNEQEQKQQAFDELKSCIVAETCEDLMEGVCYDDEVYIW